MRGYFGIGIQCPKTEVNYGTLMRSASILGASFLFLINKRFRVQNSDTCLSHKHIPTYHYQTFEQFYQNVPYGCRLIGIELDPIATPIEKFTHPLQACYLLGAEDHGLTTEAKEKCQHLIVLKGAFSMNVSVAGSIVMYDRVTKLKETV
jgi:tRNA G18 (ribose-2'-O)-methylase SpoU